MSDKSMKGRSREWIDERAQRDAKRGKNDPPYSWVPFTREKKGTEARDRYDRAYDHHTSGKGKK